MDSYALYRTLQPGEMLNWYRIEKILGRGGFGVIYLATDTNLDHQVAIKEYIPSDVATRAGDSHVHPITEEHGDMFRWGMERFIKEARNLVKFKHPNIVRVMSVFEENNTAYMVMEFEEGEDLRRYLRKPGNISEQSLKQLILPISKGLAEVHRHGFIHRDIKPANILVRKDGSPVLLDFGSARNASKFTQQSLTALVSVGYAPLEQYNQEGDEQQGPWTDIYALGGTLYYAISGDDPVESTRRGAAVFNGGKDPLIAAEYLGEGKYTPAFLRAIDWALQFGIADRPQTLSDWIPALLADEVQHDFPNTGSATNRFSSANQSLDTKTLNEMSDATVLSRERRTVQGELSNTREPNGDRDSTNLFGLAMLALLMSVVALGVWFVSDRPSESIVDNAPAVESTVTGTTAAEEIARQEREAQLRRAEQEKQQAAERALAEQNQLELETRQAEQARLEEQAAAAEKARVDAERTAEADRLAAIEATETQRLAAEDAQRLQVEAEAKAKAELLAKQDAQRKAEQEREAKRREAERLAAAREERRLKQAIGAAQNSLSVGDLSAAQQQLIIAESISSSDARVQTLGFAVKTALDEHNQPVSDDDFDSVTRKFVALRQAIEDKDAVALDRLAVSSQQSTIFKSLMKSFERIDVSIAGIRVRNADKSITATLRIDSLIRANGDRGSLSDQYTNRTITSRRVSGGWSKIEW